MFEMQESNRRLLSIKNDLSKFFCIFQVSHIVLITRKLSDYFSRENKAPPLLLHVRVDVFKIGHSTYAAMRENVNNERDAVFNAKVAS